MLQCGPIQVPDRIGHNRIVRVDHNIVGVHMAAEMDFSHHLRPVSGNGGHRCGGRFAMIVFIDVEIIYVKQNPATGLSAQGHQELGFRHDVRAVTHIGGNVFDKDLPLQAGLHLIDPLAKQIESGLSERERQ